MSVCQDIGIPVINILNKYLLQTSHILRLSNTRTHITLISLNLYIQITPITY